MGGVPFRVDEKWLGVSASMDVRQHGWRVFFQFHAVVSFEFE